MYKFLRLVFWKFAFPPNDITIELSTVCEQECEICFRFPLAISPENMSFELFKIVLARITECNSKSLKYLNFVGLGEVFCNENLIDILKYTKQAYPKVLINITTGLVPFNENAIKSILEGKLVDQLNISIDHVEAKYSYLHPFNEQTLTNIDKLLELHRAHHPKLNVRFQSILISKAQIEKILNFAKSKGIDQLHFIRLNLHAFKGNTNVKRIEQEEEIKLMTFARKYAKLNKVKITHHNSFNIFMKIASHFDKICLISDDHMFIDVNGNVLPCFYLREHSFGNIKNNSLKEIFSTSKKRIFYSEQKHCCKYCDVYKQNYVK